MMEGLPDMELRWSTADVRNSWQECTRIVIGDLYSADGAPLPMCGRSALKRAISAWTDEGLTPMIGIELEAYAFQKNAGGEIVPYDAPGAVVYGTGPGTDPLGFNDAIWAKAEELGFRLDVITAEFDKPQFEYTLTFDHALKAVDDIVLFRHMAREIALGFGIILTFMPKPLPDVGGSGMHINFSFQDAQGKNALPTPEGMSGADTLSDLARGCIAGLVHHAGLAGLVAPSALSYKRLQPASLSGYWKNWGGDHRNVTTRVSEDGGAKARLEHRMADASANPYTAVAAVLQAALLGFKNGYDLPPKETGDGFENTDATTGVATDLAAAMYALEADTALRTAVGEMLVDNQIFMRRIEAEKTARMDPAALRDFYLHFI